ncbi:MAG: homoserine kinase [Clostridiales bacterium]|nr:homoserine kinase [Clostridiales bacterium]MDN5281946.1 homoserine kinase [Candidatus Ozemobacter sp.]
MSLTVFAPATIANLSVGFDLLGAAVEPIDGNLLGDRVMVEGIAKGIELESVGPYKNFLPEKEDENIAFLCARLFFEKAAKLKNAGIKITLYKEMPIGSGLGSSASSVVATLFALNEVFDHPFSSEELLLMMGEIEGRVSGSIHYDNVAPAFLGGLQLMLNANHKLCDSIPVFDSWFWVIAYPGTSLNTSKMRALLPEKYGRADLIRYGQYLSGFIHASYKQNEKLAAEMLVDVVAEPYRSPHIPGYLPAKCALSELGVLASGISGSGPTIFAVADSKEVAQRAEDWLKKNYLTSKGGFVRICKIDRRGARVV